MIPYTAGGDLSGTVFFPPLAVRSVALIFYPANYTRTCNTLNIRVLCTDDIYKVRLGAFHPTRHTSRRSSGTVKTNERTNESDGTADTVYFNNMRWSYYARPEISRVRVPIAVTSYPRTMNKSIRLTCSYRAIIMCEPGERVRDRARYEAGVANHFEQLVNYVGNVDRHNSRRFQDENVV